MNITLAAEPSVATVEGDRPFRPQVRTAVWPHVANAVLGMWLATAAATTHPHPPTLIVSDVASGVLILLFSGLACSPRNRWAPWAVAGIGVWLMMAPFVFWAPTAAAYATDTLVGTLVFAFAVLVPGTPGQRDTPGPNVPPGWSYNPSAWSQRAGIITLAIVQFFAARYMAAHQLGHVPHAADPFFGDGTHRVLNSDVSKAFPISDAGLGAVAYLVEALTGFLGGPRRWRTMPWAVLLFGVLVVPVGVVSIVLVVLQPLAVGAWCGLCLFTAFTTVLMISPAVDEVVATGQVLLGARRDGRPFWPTFWYGESGQDDVHTAKPKHILQELANGMEWNSIPWNLAIVAAIGVWLLAAPTVLGNSGVSASSDRITGALVATFAIIGFGESARAARWACVPLGVWLAIAPWLLPGGNGISQGGGVAAGVLVVLLSLRRGPIDGRFGSWDRYVV